MVDRSFQQKVDTRPPAWVGQTPIILAEGRDRPPPVTCQGHLELENTSVLIHPRQKERMIVLEKMM